MAPLDTAQQAPKTSLHNNQHTSTGSAVRLDCVLEDEDELLIEEISIDGMCGVY